MARVAFLERRAYGMPGGVGMVRACGAYGALMVLSGLAVWAPETYNGVFIASLWRAYNAHMARVRPAWGSLAYSELLMAHRWCAYGTSMVHQWNTAWYAGPQWCGNGAPMARLWRAYGAPKYVAQAPYDAAYDIHMVRK